METNYIGTWTVSGAFAPVLSGNGGNALINMLSAASLASGRTSRGGGLQQAGGLGGRAVGSTAGALVIGVHASFVETDLSSFTGAPETSTEDVAKQTMEALANDRVEVLAGEHTRQVEHALSQPVEG
ncbi:hypothetical protein AB5J72_48635 [Streptomyces sp. CG1]|uniref:hypothetical protein n=1 Tax=Streptomyces sp. CG1 TaxID=1287523 RepID=UPI0034E1D2FE